MRARLLLIWESLRSSLWFVPTLMVIGACLLAFGAVVLDQQVKDRALTGYWWVFSGGTEGARAVLSTIAGSVMTVAGVSFSITVAVLSLTSSQFGPRLLRGFLRDTSNQIALGTFLGTYLYCLLVLRTVRSVDEGTFVPLIAVTLGIAFALISTGMLVYFIHHTSSSIQASHIISVIGSDLDSAIERLFPSKIGEGGKPDDTFQVSNLLSDGSYEITSVSEGYVQAIDGDALLAAACETNVVLYLRAKPGMFVACGDTLASVSLQTVASSALEHPVRRAFVLGREGTSAQDVLFCTRQLVEVAVRALSPGINDPFTAIACIDRLRASLGRLAEREGTQAYRSDEQGHVRVVAEPITFSDASAVAFGPLREYGCGNSLVTISLLNATAQLAKKADRAEDKRVLAQHAAQIAETASAMLLDPTGRDEVEAHYQKLAPFFVTENSASEIHSGERKWK